MTFALISLPLSEQRYCDAERHTVCASAKSHIMYCKTLYFRCILILRFWNVEISLHVNLALSQCSTSICQAFDGQTEFSQVFNFAIFFLLVKFTKICCTRKICFTVLTACRISLGSEGNALYPVLSSYCCVYMLHFTLWMNVTINATGPVQCSWQKVRKYFNYVHRCMSNAGRRKAVKLLWS